MPIEIGRERSTRLIRIIIVDDHELARAGLRTMLAGERSLEIVGEAQNGREAVELCRREKPDLILMDVRMPEMDGLTATRLIKEASPRTSIVIVTMYENPNYFYEALKAGAAGFILKDASQREMINTVRQAIQGEVLVSPKLMPHLMNRLADEANGRLKSHANKLTPRELEVLRLIVQGKSNPEIGEELVVTPGTVKVHVANILAKLEVSDRTQAAVRAIESGLVLPAKT
jgi:RNA polymerase sigma factor (sigma-70 family)